jgi:hypothetical protein
MSEALNTPCEGNTVPINSTLISSPFYLHCDQCHETYCLEDVKVPKVAVSDEFSVDRTIYTLSGTCKACNN